MLEEIKQRLDKAQENPLMGQYRIDVGFLLQELEKLQQENERYKEALNKIVNYDDGKVRVHEELTELVDIYETIAKEALNEV